MARETRLGVRKYNWLWSDAWRRLLKDRAAVFGAAICAFLCFLALFSPWIAPFDPNTGYSEGLTDMGGPVPPNSTFRLGTDNLGRDVLSRLIGGARVSLLVGVVGNGLAVVIAMALGGTAAYLGGAGRTTSR